MRGVLTVIVFFVAGPARAQYSSTVRGASTGSFVTIVETGQASARVASVADLIEREAGVFVRSRGGLGSFTSVSIRGSEAQEVAVFVDGVPLSRSATGALDLSQLPVAGLERVEIYRGVPPAEFGSEVVGGAINLVTKKGSGHDAWSAVLGGGSFGARNAAVGYSTQRRRWRSSVSFAYHGANGDFSYYDPAGTLLTAVDDRLTLRRNNHFDQIAVDATMGTRRAQLGVHGFLKVQGVPGPGIAGAETLNARLRSGRVLVDGNFGGVGRVEWRLGPFAQFERVTFENPAGENVGPFGPNVSEGEAIIVGLNGRATVWKAPQRWSLVGQARYERRNPYNLLYPAQAGQPSQRVQVGLALVDELRFAGDRFIVTPALRFDGMHSDLEGRTHGDIFFSPRFTAFAAATSWLTLRGGMGRFVRFPTLLELFGDGAFIIARPTLRPERAWGGDVGATASVVRRRVHFSVESAFFGREVEDQLAIVSGTNAAFAMNLGLVRTLGVEARAALDVRSIFRIKLDYTFLRARTVADGDKQLPGRPAHEFNARAELIGGPFRLAYDLQFVDAVYRDPNNFNFVPGRVLHGLSVAFERGGFSLLVEVRNLADLRIVNLPLGGSAQAGRSVPYPLVDFFNYPLPGRAVYLTVGLKT